jgi:hypothetical protein
MLWFYLVMNQGRYFAISNIAEGTLTLLAPCESLLMLWTQKHNTVVFRSIRKAIWGVTTLTNRTFRMTPWDCVTYEFFFVFTPFFDPNLGKFRVTSGGPFAQKPCDAVTYENFRRFLGV